MALRAEVSAGGIILREIDGELKVALAENKRTERRWVLPKGHVEPGETLEQTALREILEESGLDNVQLIKYLGCVLRTTVKENGNVVNKTIHYYLAYALNNREALTPTDERFIGVTWFSPEQAVAMIPHEAEQAFFREHLAHLLTDV